MFRPDAGGYRGPARPLHLILCLHPLHIIESRADSVSNMNVTQAGAIIQSPSLIGQPVYAPSPTPTAIGSTYPMALARQASGASMIPISMSTSMGNARAVAADLSSGKKDCSKGGSGRNSLAAVLSRLSDAERRAELAEQRAQAAERKVGQAEVLVAIMKLEARISEVNAERLDIIRSLEAIHAAKPCKGQPGSSSSSRAAQAHEQSTLVPDHHKPSMRSFWRGKFWRGRAERESVRTPSRTRDADKEYPVYHPAMSTNL